MTNNICAGLFLSLKGTPIDNDSFVDVGDIGSEADALLCLTNDTTCCGPSQTGGAQGNWLFPNGTGVPRTGTASSTHFSRDRGQSVVRLHRLNYVYPPERGRFSCQVLGDTIHVNICECMVISAMHAYYNNLTSSCSEHRSSVHLSLSSKYCK